MLARDGHYAQLSVINEAIAHGDWGFYFGFVQKIKMVTPAMVQDMAKKYLIEQGLTVGCYHAKQ